MQELIRVARVDKLLRRFSLTDFRSPTCIVVDRNVMTRIHIFLVWQTKPCNPNHWHLAPKSTGTCILFFFTPPEIIFYTFTAKTGSVCLWLPHIHDTGSPCPCTRVPCPKSHVSENHVPESQAMRCASQTHVLMSCSPHFPVTLLVTALYSHPLPAWQRAFLRQRPTNEDQRPSDLNQRSMI